MVIIFVLLVKISLYCSILGSQEDCVEWADVNDGSQGGFLDAFIAGRQENGLPVCIGRAAVEGGVQPGTYLPTKGLVFIPSEGEVYNTTQFQFLIHKSSDRKCRLDWKDSSNGKIPPGAVVGSIDQCGDYLYICKITSYKKTGSSDKLVLVTYVGKVHPWRKACYLPVNGKEEIYKHYQILIADGGDSCVEIGVNTIARKVINPETTEMYWEDCASRCSKKETCTHWTWYYEFAGANANKCILMEDFGYKSKDESTITGPKETDCPVVKPSKVNMVVTIKRNTSIFQEKLWRDDGRCGPKFKLKTGQPGQCDPQADRDREGPCCSHSGWCGNTCQHCKCQTCVNFAQEKTAREGNTIEVTCGASGNPIPTQVITAQDQNKKDLIPLPSSTKNKPIFLVEKLHSSIEISCTATNKAGEEKKTKHLKIDCFVKGAHYEGDLIDEPHVHLGINTPQQCQLLCQQNPKCQRFNWKKNTGQKDELCYLLKGKGAIKIVYDGATGPKFCPGVETLDGSGSNAIYANMGGIVAGSVFVVVVLAVLGIWCKKFRSRKQHNTVAMSLRTLSPHLTKNKKDTEDDDDTYYSTVKMRKLVENEDDFDVYDSVKAGRETVTSTERGTIQDGLNIYTNVKDEKENQVDNTDDEKSDMRVYSYMEDEEEKVNVNENKNEKE